MKQNLVDIGHLNSLLVNSNRILVGVSGGADSMALLHQIVQYRDILDKEFKVLHVDHQISKHSGAWADIVVDYCQQHGVPCEVVKVNLDGLGNNLEQAARKARYAAFTDQSCDTILLAHHANDQVETFFLKMFRGSGPKGLSGMQAVSPCWFDTSKIVVRPLLNVFRHDIEQYVADNDIPFVTDPSNSDIKFDRNWIRQYVVPMLQDRNEIADISILKVMKIQEETASLITDLAELDVSRCVNSDGSFDWYKIKNMSAARIKNMFIHLCCQRNSVDIKTKQIEMFVMGLLNASLDSNNEMLLEKVRVYKRGKRVFVETI
jgi:tRNA(Ile)-lysidine synthase